MVTPPAPGAAAALADAASQTAPPTGTALIRARPLATAMLFMKPGKPHEPVAVPQVMLGTADLLVEVELATICSSDLHTFQGRRAEPTPLILGHEAVGRIVAIGGVVPAIDGVPLVPGDRVVWSVTAHCGRCDRCARGIPQKCRSLRAYGHQRIGQGWELNGGFATHVHLPEGTAVARVDDSVPGAVLAPASCGIATAAAALDAAERAVPLRGSTVLVIGGGLVGLAVAAMARERGATVIVSDADPDRRELAWRFGAVAALDPAAGQSVEQVFESRAFRGRRGVDIVVEASGAAQSVGGAVAAVDVGGVVVLVGSVFPTEPVPVLPERLVRSLITVTGVHGYTPAQLVAAVEFLGAHWRRYPFERLVGRVYPLGEIDAALERAVLQREVRVGVDPRA